jgi:hypothetical protein
VETKIGSILNQNVSIIIFFKNVASEVLESTIREVLTAVDNVDVQAEIIIVNDGTLNFNFNQAVLFERDFKFVNLPKSIGISGAIFKGAKLAKYKKVLPIPGHDMFSHTAVSNVLNLTDKGRLILGCRSNLAKERPIMKKFASRILRDLYRHIAFYYIGDIHGLIMYEKQDLLNYLNQKGGHTNAIRVVTNVLVSGGLLVQTVAPIKEGHRKERNVNFFNRITKPVNVIQVIIELLKIRKLVKNSQQGDFYI